MALVVVRFGERVANRDTLPRVREPSRNLTGVVHPQREVKLAGIVFGSDFCGGLPDTAPGKVCLIRINRLGFLIEHVWVHSEFLQKFLSLLMLLLPILHTECALAIYEPIEHLLIVMSDSLQVLLLGSSVQTEDFAGG